MRRGCRLRFQVVGVGAGLDLVEKAADRMPGFTALRVHDDADLLVRVDPALRGCPESYRLLIGENRWLVEATEAAGAFRGLATLTQILRQCPDRVPCGEIEDSPDFPLRGVMLDISRDKVPTMATLFALIDDLAGWKVNHVELYMEHTFAYRRHRTVWAHASPLTAAEVQALDAYCRERFIELAPNQNSFGHMERWLKHPAYRRLAECPDGYRLPSGEWRGPSTLDPTTPAALRFLDGLYDELLPNFTSPHFHVGGDEAWELGKGRSGERCRRLGLGHVYREFLDQLAERVGARGRRMCYWGDMVWNHFPGKLRELNRRGIMVDWGYYRAYPFARHGEALARAGLDFWFAPGTSTWSTLLGCNEAGFGSNASATAAGRDYGARGILNTDWGDNGHWQYLPVSYAPFAAGAAMAWCGKTNPEMAIRTAMDAQVFLDPTGRAGEAVLGLADTWRHVGRGVTQSHLLDRILRGGLTQPLPDRISTRTLRATEDHVDACLATLGGSRMNRPDAGLMIEEFANAARMARHACRLAASRLEGTAAATRTRRVLVRNLDEIMAEHARLWRARNRPGGLNDSLRVFRERRTEYAEGTP